MAAVKKIKAYPPAVSNAKLTDVDNDPPIQEEIDIWEIPNAIISSYGYVFKHFKCVDFFVSPRHRGAVKFTTVLANYFLKKQIRIKGTAISFVHGWYDNYYHFVTECLPKLYVLKDYLDHATLVFPKKVSKFHKEYLALLGFEKVIYINENEVAVADRVVSCNFMNRDLNHHHIITPQFRDWMFEKIPAIKTSSFHVPKIFINREKARYRKAINNEELKEQMDGFVNINLEDYSVLEQMQLFYQAEEIHAIHGAALSNIMFCKEKTKVVEYIHEDYIQHCFHKFSDVLILDYHKIKCKGNYVNSLPGYCDINITIVK